MKTEQPTATVTVKIYTKDIFIPVDAADKIGARAGSVLLFRTDEDEGRIEIAVGQELEDSSGFTLSTNNGQLRASNAMLRAIPKGEYTVKNPEFDGELDWFELVRV